MIIVLSIIGTLLGMVIGGCIENNYKNKQVAKEVVITFWLSSIGLVYTLFAIVYLQS